jgi:hypothetical protein
VPSGGPSGETVDICDSSEYMDDNDLCQPLGSANSECEKATGVPNCNTCNNDQCTSCPQGYNATGSKAVVTQCTAKSRSRN